MIEVWNGSVWVEGTPSDGQKFRRTDSSGGVLISYYSEPKDEASSKVHKAAWKKRLIPFWPDVEAARDTDATIRFYFELISDYRYVDVSLTDTQNMIGDFVNRVKAVVPASAITAEVLLANPTDDEAY